MTHSDPGANFSGVSTQHGTSNLFLLVDTARYPGIWRVLEYRFRRLPWVSLQTNDKQAGAGPVLVHVASNQTRTLAWFIEHTGALHCLSWIESTLALPELASHLQNLLHVQAEDSASYDIRYYDTRILPAWYQALTPEQEAYALAPIGSWTYLDRDGMPCTLFGHAQERVPAAQTLRLDTAQEHTLLAATLPDIILERLEQNGNADLAAMPRAQRYAFIADQVTKATTQYGIIAIQELVLFCSLALGIGRNFDKLLPVAQVLRKFGATTVPGWPNTQAFSQSA